MAEINIADLPIIPSNEFTNNDSFVIINDSKAQLLPRSTFQLWMEENVKGDKGDQGIQGPAGANGTNGANGISATHSWNGTTLTITSASGTSSANLKGAAGNNGTNGTNGLNGWSAIYALVDNGSGGKVIKITSWTGGTGTPPASNRYIGLTGLVTNIADAINIKGDKGDQGLQGVAGSNGWGPVLAIANNSSSQQVIRIIDWVGGTGTKPATGYIGNSGLVATADAATPLSVTVSQADVRATTLTGLSLTNKTDVVAGDTILQAFGKTQAQLDNMSNQAGQVKVNYTGLTVSNFTANTYKIFDIVSATPTIVAAPTTTYPRSTPNAYVGVFDANRGTSPTGRLIENPINGQVHGWRIQGSYSGKSTSGTTAEVLSLRIRNPVSGFVYVKAITLSNNLAAGTFADELITIADNDSIPSPSGYILEAAMSGTDSGLSVTITAITRVSFAKEVYIA